MIQFCRPACWEGQPSAGGCSVRPTEPELSEASRASGQGPLAPGEIPDDGRPILCSPITRYRAGEVVRGRT